MINDLKEKGLEQDHHNSNSPSTDLVPCLARDVVNAAHDGNERLLVSKYQELKSSTPNGLAKLTSADFLVILFFISNIKKPHSYDRIKDMLADMENVGLEKTISHYNQLLKTVQYSHRNLQQLDEILEEIRSAHLSFDSTSIFFIIQAYARSGNVDKMLDWRIKFEAFGEQDAVALYTELMLGYSRASNMTESQRLFEEMLEKGHAPSSLSYTTLMSTCPNSQTITSTDSLIGGYIDQGDADSAILLYDQMLSVGLKPNVQTLHTLMDAFVSLDRIDSFYEVYQQLVKSFGATSESFNILLKIHANSGDEEKIIKIYKAMKSLNLKMDVVTFNTIIHGLSKSGKFRQAENLVKVMKQQGIPPNDTTFAGLLVGFVHLRDHENMELFFKRLSIGGHDIQNWNRLYAILFRGLLGHSEKLRYYWNDLQQKHTWNSVSITSYLRSMFESGEFEASHQVYNEFIKDKMELDFKSYRIVFRILLHFKKSRQCIELTEEIRRRQILTPQSAEILKLLDLVAPEDIKRLYLISREMLHGVWSKSAQAFIPLHFSRRRPHSWSTTETLYRYVDKLWSQGFRDESLECINSLQIIDHHSFHVLERPILDLVKNNEWTAIVKVADKLSSAIDTDDWKSKFIEFLLSMADIPTPASEAMNWARTVRVVSDRLEVSLDPGRVLGLLSKMDARQKGLVRREVFPEFVVEEPVVVKMKNLSKVDGESMSTSGAAMLSSSGNSVNTFDPLIDPKNSHLKTLLANVTTKPQLQALARKFSTLNAEQLDLFFSIWNTESEMFGPSMMEGLLKKFVGGSGSGVGEQAKVPSEQTVRIVVGNILISYKRLVRLLSTSRDVDEELCVLCIQIYSELGKDQDVVAGLQDLWYRGLVDASDEKTRVWLWEVVERIRDDGIRREGERIVRDMVETE